MPSGYGKADIIDKYGRKMGELRWAPDHSANLAAAIVYALAYAVTIGVVAALGGLLALIFHRPRVMIPLLVAGGVAIWSMASFSQAEHARADAVRRQAAKPAELRSVPVADQGIDFKNPVWEDIYPLIEMSTRKRITDNGEPVYVNGNAQRVAGIGRARIPVQAASDPFDAWQTTGLSVSKGDLVHVRAAGTWCWGRSPGRSPDCSDADGTSGRPTAEEREAAVLPTGRFGQLLGEVRPARPKGNGLQVGQMLADINRDVGPLAVRAVDRYLPLGARAEVAMKESGELYLYMNAPKNRRENISGELLVDVWASKAAAPQAAPQPSAPPAPVVQADAQSTVRRCDSLAFLERGC